MVNRALFLSDFQSLLGPVPVDTVLKQDLHHFLGIGAEPFVHGLDHDLGEAITAFIPFRDELLHDAAHFRQRFVDACRVLAGELDDLNRVPDDVVLADCLKPEGLDAERAFADFAVPDEEAGREDLALDLGLAGRVNEEDQHVLLAGVEPGAAGFVLAAEGSPLGRLEVGGELRKHGENVGVVEPGHSSRRAWNG